MKPSSSVARRRKPPQRGLVVLACLVALGISAHAQVSESGGVQPYFSPAPVVNLSGVVVEVGHRTKGDYGWLYVQSGGRFLAGGIHLYAGSLDVSDTGSFVTLSGADNSLWIGRDRAGFASIRRGGVVEATSCALGQCETVVGGTTGTALNFAGTPFPPSIENGAKSMLTITDSGSRLTALGTFRVAQAFVGDPGAAIPSGVTGGTAVGVVQVSNGGTLVTGNALMGIGPSGPGRNGSESAVAYVGIDGPGSSWTLLRNDISGVQAMLTLGASGDAAGSQITSTLHAFNGAKVRVDGSSGGVSPGVVVGGGISSMAYLWVHDPGSALIVAGQTGFINLGGSGAQAGGYGDLLIDNGGQVYGEGDNGLVFMSVGRNGTQARGNLTIAGRSDGGVRSSLTLSGRGTAGSGGDGQSAFLNVGRNGASGKVSVSDGALLTISAPRTANPSLTTTGAGFALGRDAGTVGEMNIFGVGSEVIVASSDRRPFVAVGQNGTGILSIGGGASLQLLATDSFASGANNLLYVGGGGTGAGNGTLQLYGAGSQLLQGPDNDSVLIAGSSGSGGAGGVGSIDVRAGAMLSTTVLVLGDGTFSQGSLLVDNSQVLLRGEVSRATSTGAALSVGRDGGDGKFYLVNHSRLQIDSNGSFAGLIIGGTGTLPGGTGTVGLYSGALLEVMDRGRFDQSIWVGRAGAGSLDVIGATARVNGQGRVIVGAAGGASGRLTVGAGGLVQAGRLLLLGGNESPGANGSGQVQANQWEPLAANLATPSATGADAWVQLHDGGSLIADYVGMALATGSTATLEVLSNASLSVRSGMMVGALGRASFSASAGRVDFSAADASLVVGSFKGGEGSLGLDQGGTLRMPGETARLDVGRGAGSAGSVSVVGAMLDLSGSMSAIHVGGAGNGSLLLKNSARAQAATLVAGSGSGGLGLVDVQGGAQLSLGSANRNADFTGLALGMGAGASGQLTISGAGSLVRVNSASPIPVLLGDAGTGRLLLADGGRLEVRSLGASLGSIQLGSAGSVLDVAPSSSLLLAGAGNYLAVNAGRARVAGQLDLQLNARPLPNALVLPGATGTLALPQASLAQAGDNRYVSLAYAGYVPKANDYLPLFTANTIEVAANASISTYRVIDMGGKTGYEFSLGAGQVSFRIEAPGAGLYPVLERSNQSGNDVWGLRFVTQAVYLDWNQGSSARVAWLQDAKDGTLRPYFDSVGTQMLTHGSIADTSKDQISYDLARRLWGDAVATSGQASGNRLGNALALPVFDSRTLAAAPLNAVTVRFAGSDQKPTCPEKSCSYSFGYTGYAFDTLAPGAVLPIDIGNQRKSGEVVVVADDSFIAKHTTDDVAGVIYHEVGHALGLVHTGIANGTTGVMDDFKPGPYLSDRVSATAEIIGGVRQATGDSQNAMYQVLRYTFGWDDARLAAFGGVAGSLDGNPQALADSFAQATLKSDLGRVYNVLVLGPSFLADGESAWQSLLYLPSASAATLSFAALKGLPFRVLASSAPGDNLDLYFEAEAGSGLAGVSGDAVVGGRVMQVSASGADTLFGHYAASSSAVTPVPEPATWLMLLGGGLALLQRGWRRAGQLAAQVQSH